MRQFKITERITPRSSRSVNIYYSDVEKYPTVTPSEEVELAKRIQMGDMAARDRLATANLRFVISVAKMYTRNEEMFNDLVSVGNIGLIEAAEKFDPSRGFKFISFAVWHIRKEMLKYLGDNARLIRIPQNKILALRGIFDTAGKLTMEMGREATLEEIIEKLKESNDPKFKTLDNIAINDMMCADNMPSSLDAQFTSGTSEGGTLYDLIPSKENLPDHDLDIESVRDVIERLVSSLSPVAQIIVKRRHGIGNKVGFEESFGTIGHDLDFSSERVRQIYVKAIKTLMLKARKSGIKKDDFMSR